MTYDQKAVWTKELVVEGNRCSYADTQICTHVCTYNSRDSKHSLNPLRDYQSTYSGSTWLCQMQTPHCSCCHCTLLQVAYFKEPIWTWWIPKCLAALHEACVYKSNITTILLSLCVPASETLQSFKPQNFLKRFSSISSGLHWAKMGVKENQMKE